MKYVRITNDSTLPGLSSLGPFRCVVVVEQEVSEIRRNDVSKWLVESGCLYMMAWGLECSSWDTSVDLANLELFDNEYEEIPDARFVTTTWHDDEPLSEVFWFSKHSAFHASVDIENTVILHISDVDKREHFAEEYSNA